MINETCLHLGVCQYHGVKTSCEDCDCYEDKETMRNSMLELEKVVSPLIEKYHFEPEDSFNLGIALGRVAFTLPKGVFR